MSDKKLSQTAKKVPSKSGSGPGGTLGGADGGNKIESSKRPPPPPPAKTKLPGFAPYAPVIRPGHYDHIEESLVPPDVDRDAIPRHPLEKSSSSFLKGVVTPSSTPSEEEAGVLGMNMLCVTKKRHYVDRKLRDEKVASHFGNVMIVIAIINNGPCLVLQILYVFYQKFRVALLLRYDICFYVLCGLVLLSMGIKFFTGLARTRPWHIMMVIFKSLLWAWNYTLVGVLLEYLYFKQIADEHVHLVKEFRYKKYTPKERDAAEYKLYTQFVTRIFSDELSVHGEDGEDDLETKNLFFFFGISYGMALLVIMRILKKCVKLNYFGPIYPFISYTLTFLMILGGTLYVMVTRHITSVDDADELDEDKLWMLGQVTCGPLIGVIIAELFVVYLQAVLRGKLCPLKKDEYIYAAAHM